MIRFYPCFKFYLLCLKLNNYITHYHSQKKQGKVNFSTKDKIEPDNMPEHVSVSKQCNRKCMLYVTHFDPSQTITKLFLRIGLMHDDVICFKFTTKPCVHKIFLEPLPPSCCFHKVIVCILVPWEIVLLKI